MSANLVSGLRDFGVRAMFRRLGADSEARSVEKSPSRDVQPGRTASFLFASRDQDSGRVDAIAGSEFVDDLIREQE